MNYLPSIETGPARPAQSEQQVQLGRQPEVRAEVLRNGAGLFLCKHNILQDFDYLLQYFQNCPVCRPAPAAARGSPTRPSWRPAGPTAARPARPRTRAGGAARTGCGPPARPGTRPAPSTTGRSGLASSECYCCCCCCSALKWCWRRSTCQTGSST